MLQENQSTACNDESVCIIIIYAALPTVSLEVITLQLHFKAIRGKGIGNHNNKKC